MIWCVDNANELDADSAKRYRQYYNGLTDAEKENDHEVSVNAYLKSGMAPKSVRYAEVLRRTFGDLRAYEEAVADGTLSGEAERIRGEMVFTHLAEVMNEIEKKTGLYGWIYGSIIFANLYRISVSLLLKLYVILFVREVLVYVHI